MEVNTKYSIGEVIALAKRNKSFFAYGFVKEIRIEIDQKHDTQRPVYLVSVGSDIVKAYETSGELSLLGSVKYYILGCIGTHENWQSR